MWIVLALIGGILVGVAASAVYFRARTIGLLRVDRSDPSEPPYLFLEVQKKSGRPATWTAGGSANPEREPDLARITPAFMEPSTKRRRFIRDGRDQQIDG